ncbi:MAG: hypothetical protein IKM59_03040 [Oscillospiraceae bacterium]|nr:hypothetical protein [Oscillospiraceae bacterium]
MKHPVLKQILGVLLCGCKHLGPASHATEGVALSAVSRGNTELAKRNEVSSIELAILPAEGGDCIGKVWLPGFT